MSLGGEWVWEVERVGEGGLRQGGYLGGSG